MPALETMTDGSPDFTDAHVSLMRAGLAPGVFAQLSGRKTSESSVSLDRHIQAVRSALGSESFARHHRARRASASTPEKSTRQGNSHMLLTHTPLSIRHLNRVWMCQRSEWALLPTRRPVTRHGQSFSTQSFQNYVSVCFCPCHRRVRRLCLPLMLCSRRATDQRYDASSGPPTFDREADKVKGACFSEKQAVLHTRVCLSRNVSASPKTLHTSFPFAPSISRSDRRNAEYVLSHCFGLFSQALAGKYTPLDQISDAAASDASTAMGLWQLNIDRPLPNSLQAACGAARDWPDGRGVFASEGMDLFALVNSDFMDHVRLCASQVGGNSVAAFQRCCHAVAELNQSVSGLLRIRTTCNVF